MEPQFIIAREDLLQDPLTIITDGLLIGRLRECELLLNHPTVSRVQAGIKAIEGNYYIFSLRAANPVILNGKAVEENEALASGDVLEVGPFVVDVDRQAEGLYLTVTLRIGVQAEEVDTDSLLATTQKLEMIDLVEGAPKKKRAPRPAPLPGTKALDIFWDKRIREAGKMVRPSTLFPRGQRRSGKGQFNWVPTSDLKRKWPASFFIWAIVIVGLTSVGAAFWYADAFAPAPVSSAHATARFTHVPPIAVRPVANSCTSCHSLSGTVEQKCSSCHQAQGFAATVIKPHQDAGIGCVTCHSEHQGADFKPREAAFMTCTACHRDGNNGTYNGRKVGTPHGGTFGYPVVEAKWKWKGLEEEEWTAKKISVTRLPTDHDDAWRSKQFHSLHLYRVKASGDLSGNTDKELSCSTCHKSFNPIDRETPRKTCAGCHNGQVDQASGRTLVAATKPNCVSCHVQHVKGSWHWNPSLMAD
ncbi:MAG: FHA domain-containing protein [Pyrinomonadaceae bacterium]